MRRATLAAIALTACSTPPLTIQLAIQSGDLRTCPRGSDPDPLCSDVPIACEAMLLVRVLDPNDPLEPFISTCQQVLPDKAHDLCAIASLDIPASAMPASGTLPERTLEVQVVVMPLVTDANNQPDCASAIPDLSFSANGLPISSAGAVPIGGRAFYHPGDAATVVQLGCNDLSTLNAPSCVGIDKVSITASVNELDTQVSVSTDTASALAVSVGEPSPRGSGYALNLGDTLPLTRTLDVPPSWTADVAAAFTDTACLDVFEDTTPTLTCLTGVAGKASLDFTGAHISAARLAQLVAAVQTVDASFTLGSTSPGLVVGIALDQFSNPVPGVVVVPTTNATVRYLAADGASLQSTGTSTSGIFLSTDAAFLTSWTANVGGVTSQAFGGLVDGKVTVVVLQTAASHT